MKPRRTHRKNHALTLMELLVVIFILALFMAMLVPSNHGRAKSIARRMACVNNLKQIGLAEKIWADNHEDKYPFETSVTNGGTMELDNGRNAWMNFLVLSNKLVTPKILLCPADDEHWPPATNFSSQISGHISYFAALITNDDPQSVLSGDDNFEIGGVPVKTGWLELPTNAPISWATTRHNKIGNLLLGDGSVQGSTTSGLRTFLQQTGLATNRLAIP